MLDSVNERQSLSLSLVLSYFLLAFLSFYILSKILALTHFSPLREIPGTSLFSFFRNLRTAIKEDLGLFGIVLDLHHKYGAISKMFWMNREVVIVTGASECNYVLQTHYHRSSTHDRIFHRLMDDKYNTFRSLRGEKMDNLKKNLSTAFTIDIIRDMVPTFQANSEKLLDLWTKKLENSLVKDYAEISIQEDISRLTMDNISRCAFGYESNTLSSNDNKKINGLRIMMNNFLMDMDLSNLVPFYKYLPSKSNQRFKEAQEDTWNHVQSMIDQKRQHPVVAEGRRDILDHLMLLRDGNTGETLSNAELVCHVKNFIVAGSVTTSLLITWGLLCLARNPGIQEKLRKEIKVTFPDRERRLTLDDLEKIPYLDCVIKEILRFHPILPGLSKVTVEDDVINGYRIPAGTEIYVWPGAPHLLPRYWSEPEKFKPERFSDPNKPQSPGTWTPFGAGRTSCLGRKIALAKAKTVFITILRDLSFKEAVGFQYITRYKVVCFPDPPLILRVERAV